MQTPRHRSLRPPKRTAAKRTSLADERTALARDNQLRRRVHDFADRIHAVIDTLDYDQKQQLLRLLVEDVRVTGWHVQIHLKIPLADDPGTTRQPRPPTPGPEPSTDIGLRSVGGHDFGVVEEAVEHRGGEGFVAEVSAHSATVLLEVTIVEPRV